MATKRVPNVHLATVNDILTTEGSMPRFALARRLVDRSGCLSFKTSMEYVQAMLTQGDLRKVGVNVTPKLGSEKMEHYTLLSMFGLSLSPDMFPPSMQFSEPVIDPPARASDAWNVFYDIMTGSNG